MRVFFYESVVDSIREPLLILNKAMCVVSANASFYKYFKTDEHETESRFLLS